MVALAELVDYGNRYLGCAAFQDFCPNGLQIEGRSEVNCIASAVTASQAAVNQAVAAGVDVLLVHHGYFWRGEEVPIVGLKHHRIAALIKADISLIAYHLPLDAHPVVGNNAQLAKRLGLVVESIADSGPGKSILFFGYLEQPCSALELQTRIQQQLQRQPLHVGPAHERIETVAWCTGAAQGFIEQVIAKGSHAYISGEISEQTVHAAREAGVDYFAAGHHATERYGVQAFAKHLSQRFGLKFLVFDDDNPV